MNLLPDLTIDKLVNNPSKNFFLMAGPCLIEGSEMAFEIARHIRSIAEELEIPYIFKGSFRKANRSRIDSYTGIGDEKALKVLKSIKEELGVPVVTDIHLPEDATLAAQYVDILQIPAFLCRQTDLLLSAARTGKIVSIKKGQFLSPESMQHAVRKLHAAGNSQVILVERGTTFGYQDLVVDFRAIPKMRQIGCPAVIDATHSLQQPNSSTGVTGGEPQMIETIAKAGIAVGADGIFIETHPNPAIAKSDGANMLPLSELRPLLEKLVKIRSAVLDS